MISELGQSDYHPGICLEALGKTMESDVRRVGVPSGVRSSQVGNRVPSPSRRLAQPVLVAPHMRSVAQIDCRQLPGWLAPVSVSSLNCGVIRLLQQASSITAYRNVHSTQPHNIDRQTDRETLCCCTIMLISHSILSPLSFLSVAQFKSHTKIILLRHSSTPAHAIQIAQHAPHHTTYSHYSGMVIICTTCCNILTSNSLTTTTSAECSRNCDVTYVSLETLLLPSRWTDAH